MSDQPYKADDQPDTSYEADTRAGQDSDDDSDVGLAGTDLGASDEPETSHDADIDAGYDDARTDDTTDS